MTLIPDCLSKFRFIKVDDEKRPIEKDWGRTANYAYDDLQFVEWVEKNKRYGVLCGWGGLTVVDFDEEEMQAACLPKLPPTFTVKTARKGLFHLYYTVTDEPRSEKFLSDRGDTLVDVQGPGKQVIGPNTIIPDGRKYEIVDNVPIYATTMESILKPLRKYQQEISRKELVTASQTQKTTPSSVSYIDGVEEIRRKLPISALLAEFGIPVSKNPTDCPMHASKGGRCFSYDDNKNGGVFNCFHCGARGTVITLYALTKKIPWGEAKHQLATRFNIEPDARFMRESIRLPTSSRSITERTIGRFGIDIGKTLRNKAPVYFKIDIKSCVEIRKIALQNKKECTGFAALTSARFITIAELHARCFVIIEDKDTKTKHNVEKNIPSNIAALVIESDQFQQQLRPISRIFTVPIPIIYQGALTFPKKGYDERFQSWLDPESPEIESVTQEEAQKIIDEVFSEFCFKDPVQDKTHAVAALLTPFLRGLYGSFTERTPLFFYIANRERAGKDFCAGITGILFEGIAVEDAPIPTGKDGATGNEELRKRITSSLIFGRKRIHFSNCKGFLNSSVLENIITNKRWSDRILGRNQTVEMDNELDFSLSGNVGITFTPDMEYRSRFINFMLDLEDPNARTFKRPDLHEYVLRNRGKILGALFALVQEWHHKGMPSGSKPFTSFPNWAAVCGGIMESNRLGSPCEPQAAQAVGGNQETQSMKLVYELGLEHWGETPFTKKDLMEKLSGWIEEHSTLGHFAGVSSDVEKEKMSARMKFGKLIERYCGRILSGIRLVKVSEHSNSRHNTYLFKKVTPATSATSPPRPIVDEDKKSLRNQDLQVVKVAHVALNSDNERPNHVLGAGNVFVPRKIECDADIMRHLEVAERELGRGLSEDEIVRCCADHYDGKSAIGRLLLCGDLWEPEPRLYRVVRS